LKFTSFIAQRYIFSKKSHHFFAIISVLTITGVVIGTAAMIVVLSIFNGFETQLRNNFLAANAHVIMYQNQGIKDHHHIEKATNKLLMQDRLSGTAPFVYAETMAEHGSGLVNVMIKGIDPIKREDVQSIRGIIHPKNALIKLQKEMNAKKTPSIPSVIIGSGLSRLLEADIGENISLIAPGKENIFGLFHDHKIIGIYDSGLSHYDNKLVILTVPAAQKLLSMGSRVTGVEIGLDEPWDSTEIKNKLHKHFPHFVIKKWQEFNPAIFENLSTERVLVGLLVALVVLVGCFNILTTLFISVFQKERDISLLRSMGCSQLGIMKIIVQKGFFIGLLGSCIGSVLAFFVAKGLEKYQIITLPDVYMLASLPVEYNPSVYLLITAVSMVVASGAGILPAYAAIKQNPSVSLKSRGT